MSRRSADDRLDRIERSLRERFDALLTGQPWVETWLNQAVRDRRELSRWVWSHSAGARSSMGRFPLYSLVRSVPGVSLPVPRPGEVGIVINYFNDGALSVRPSPTASEDYTCKTEWLELVACVHGASVEDFGEMLSRKDL